MQQREAQVPLPRPALRSRPHTRVAGAHCSSSAEPPWCLTGPAPETDHCCSAAATLQHRFTTHARVETGACRHPEQPQGGDSPHTYQGMTGPTWCVWPSHAVPKRGTDTRHQLDELKRHAQRSQRPHTQHEPIRTKRLEQGNPDRKQEVDWWVPGASSVGRCGSRGVCSRCGVSF